MINATYFEFASKTNQRIKSYVIFLYMKNNNKNNNFIPSMIAKILIINFLKWFSYFLFIIQNKLY